MGKFKELDEQNLFGFINVETNRNLVDKQVEAASASFDLFKKEIAKKSEVSKEQTPDNFLSVYFANLIKAKNKHPDLYQWSEVDVLDVFRRMSESLRNGTYDRHGHAVKWTCKDLGIAHTRTAIDKIFKTKKVG